MTVMFVGSNPSVSQVNPAVPFVGSRSHARLQRWISAAAAGRAVVLVNVSDAATPGNRPLKVSEFNLGAVTDAVAVHRPCAIVALGKTASKALSKLHLDYLEMPHPSGRNRLLNDPEYERLRVAECAVFISERA